jgi:hypothetical protein
LNRIGSFFTGAAADNSDRCRRSARDPECLPFAEGEQARRRSVTNLSSLTKECHREGELAKVLNKHVSTIVRSTRRGVRGHVLKSVLVGGQRYIEREAFAEFIHAINQPRIPVQASPRREEELRQIGQELDSLSL